MATLSDLVSIVTARTDIPRATVFAYGRFAREAGLISQKGRGRGAAAMTETDAANLLIALCGTAVTREAGDAIHLFRRMKGFAFFEDDETEPMLRAWLSDFRLASGGKDEIGGDFGSFLAWLILELKSGKLLSLLKRIPVLHIPDDVREKWADHYNGRTLEKAIEDGVLRPTTPSKVGEDVNLNIIFDRSTPRVTVEIRRKWDLWDTIFEAIFILKKQIHKFMSDVIVSATMNEQVLLYIGDLLRASAGGAA